MSGAYASVKVRVSYANSRRGEAHPITSSIRENYLNPSRSGYGALQELPGWEEGEKEGRHTQT